MPKSFSFGKNQAGVFITLLVLISLGAVYFFSYLPNSEKAVQERRFRCLRKIDTNIRTKINNSTAQISYLLKNYLDDSAAKPANSTLAKLKTFISKYPKDHFTYLLPEQADKYFIDKNNNQLVDIGEDNTNTIKFYIDPGQHFTLLAKKITVVKTNRLNKGKLMPTFDTTYTAIGIQFEFDQFVKPLLPSDVFDNYIVFIKNKKAYETFPSGLNYSEKDADSLMSIKNKLTTPGMRSLSIGGTDYKLFSQPLYAYSDTRWIVVGLVLDSTYQREKNQLPLWVLLMLLTVVIAMLVSLPWIKLFHMGSKDRLTLNDGIASVLISMLLMSLLFFVLFKYRFSFKEEQLPYAGNTTKSDASYPMNAYSRNMLAAKITNAFEREINSAYSLLNSFDEIHRDSDLDVYLLGKGKKGLFTKYDSLFNKKSKGIDVKQVFWLDSMGNEKTNLTIDPRNDPKSNYSERDYFKNAVADKYNKGGPNPFYIDQLVSRTEGIFRSVISKNNPNTSMVAVMAFTVKSLDNVVMPDGYQFAMIDNYGRVLYNSKPNRNLNENLKDELTDSTSLVSCITARTDTCFKAEYYGRQYNVKIKPVPNLPYFTIIFEDVEYNDARDTEAYAFTLSMLICMLIFVSVKYGVVFFASSRRSYFKKQHFDTSWIGPHVKSHHEYNLATIANLFMVLMLIVFFNWSLFLTYLYILLVSVVFTSLFANLIFACKYRKIDPDSDSSIFKIIAGYIDSDPDPYKYDFKITATYWLLCFVLLIDIAACLKLTGQHIIFLFLYEVILIVIFPVILFLAKSLLTKARYYKQKRSITWTFTHSYALMAVTRLIISSGIPVAFFFIYSNNYEQNLDTRYRQLTFAKAFTESQKVDLTTKSIDTVNKELDSLKNNIIYTSGIYFDGLFIDSISVEADKNVTSRLTKTSSYTREDSVTSEILSAFRLRTSHIEVMNNNLDMPSADSIAFFNKLNKPCYDGAAVQTFYKLNSNRYLEINSLPHTGYRRPQFFYLGILLLASVFAFYHIIHQVVRKLFALPMHPVDAWGPMDIKLLNNKANRRILIVGSPGSDTLSKIEPEIRTKNIQSTGGSQLILDEGGTLKKNVFTIDMMKISAENGELDKDWKNHITEAFNDHLLVIINHFEYNICDGRANKVKLELLESLIEENIDRVIIVSTVHPLTFLDSFSQQQNDKIQGSDIMRWYMLLGSFKVLIDPIANLNPSEDTVKEIMMPDRAVMEETAYSGFLHGMQEISLKSLNDEINSKPQEEETKAQITDSMVFKLQLTSQYFYMDIWQSLTREEKFILYDLAEDGLVNSYDDFNLSMLICKQLIIRHDGVLMLFNRSFRNFILTAIGEKEISRIKDQIRDNGNWGNLKMPLNIAILAILAFLFTSQQETYSRVITYITAFGAAVPTTLKIFSMFGSGGKAPKSE